MRAFFGLVVVLTLVSAASAHGGGPYRGPGEVVPPAPWSWETYWWQARREMVTVRTASPAPRLLAELAGQLHGFAASDTVIHGLAIEAFARLARVGAGEGVDVFEVLRRGLRSPSEELRARSLHALGICGDPRSAEVLVHVLRGTLFGREQLRDPGGERMAAQFRLAACRGLGELASAPRVRGQWGLQDRIHAVLAEVLGSVDVDVKLARAAVAAVGKLAPERARPDREDRALVRRAVRTLMRCYDRQWAKRDALRPYVFPAVASLLSRGESGLHRYVCERIVAELRVPAKRRDYGVRVAGVRALAKLVTPCAGGTDYCELLHGLAIGEEEPLVGPSWIAIAEIGGKKNYGRLLAGLRSKDEDVASWCAVALGVSGYRRTVSMPTICEVQQELLARCGEGVKSSLKSACMAGKELCERGRRRGERLPMELVRELGAKMMDAEERMVARMDAAERLSKAFRFVGLE